MSELLPCPFCDGYAGEITDATRVLGVFKLVHWCPVIGPITIECSTREAVIATWNTRALPAVQPDATSDKLLAAEAEIDRLREVHRFSHLHVEALSEIKAVLEGGSEQTIEAIMDKLLQEIAARAALKGQQP